MRERVAEERKIERSCRKEKRDSCSEGEGVLYVFGETLIVRSTRDAVNSARL